MNPRYLLAAVLALALLHPATGRAETFHTCRGFITSLPAVISTQGTWCLRQDLATQMTSGTAITIAANNVTLDCNDYKIGGLAPGVVTQAVGVASLDRQNITVRHCNIRGFLFGLSLVGVSSGGLVVEDNRFDGATRIGLQVTGDDSVVRRNVVRNTGGSTSQPGLAVGINTGGEVDILDNTVAGALAVPDGVGRGEAYGIWATNIRGTVAGNRIRNLVASGPIGGSFGIVVRDNGLVMIDGNELIGSGIGYGVACDNPLGRLRNNAIHGFNAPGAVCTNAGGNDVTAPL
jgi:hypothetical protein